MIYKHLTHQPGTDFVQDRLEIVRLSGYTEGEKHHLAAAKKVNPILPLCTLLID